MGRIFAINRLAVLLCLGSVIAATEASAQAAISERPGHNRLVNAVIDKTIAPDKTFHIVSSQRQHPYFALKTNLLLWGVGAPNLGAEFRLGGRLSLAASGAFANWQIKSRYALQFGKAGLELKYWFNSDRGPFTGWSCGVWGVLSGRFDVQSDSGWQGDHIYSSGVSGGYSFAAGRRLNIELSASPGWFYAPEIRNYHTVNNVLIWRQTRYNTSRVMLKFAVNLIWLPGKER
ncbi:MAG: DUF3575 domain-containing protein [Alistipes sp.]|nr:DUF3575 domain-containing protein [Alistipes sp.]